MSRQLSKGRSTVLAITVIVLVVLIGVVLRNQSGQLTYNGRSLHRHIELAGSDTIEKAVLELGPERTVPILIEALERKDGFIKKVQLKLWPKLPASFRQKRLHWTPMPSFSTQMKVATALMHIGSEGSNAVPALVQLVKDMPYPGNGMYIAALSEAGRDSLEARQTLIALSKSTNQQLATMVALELGRFASDAKEVVPTLISNLESQASVPYNELLAVRMLGTNAASAAPAVLLWLDDPRTKGNAAAALARLGPGAAVALPVITQHAASNEMWAVEALMNIGSAASNALPTLTNVMHTNRDITRFLAIAAIGRISGDQKWAGETMATNMHPRLVRSVGRTWSSPWNDMRNLSIGLGEQETACWLLSEMGPPARSAVPALTNIVARTNGWAPIFAARALWMIESNSGFAVPRLVMALTNRSDIDAQLAARVLGEIGPPAVAAIPELERACQRSWRVRREAVPALRQIRDH